MNPEYQKLMASGRVSPQTREALIERAQPDDPNYVPRVLSATQLTTLRTIVARVLPQPYGAGGGIDLAQRMDQSLHSAKGDGWRYANLPPDQDAFRQGLPAIEEFVKKSHSALMEQLSGDQQDSVLRAIRAGEVSSAHFDLRRWLEDLRALAVQIYVSHPATLAAMGYSGIGDDENGFILLGIGQVEAWEPKDSHEKL